LWIGAMQNLAPTSTAEAPAQAAGYLFQLRYALYRALKRLVRDPTASIGIERLDDISIETSGTITEIDQLKHTSKEEAQLTDNSPSVWRTIGNWSRLVEKDNLNLAILELVLITNSSVADGSGLSKLGLAEEDRDQAAALTALKSAAIESNNQKSKSDRDVFLALDETVQAALTRAMRVVPNSPNLAALGPEIEDIVHYACEPAQLSDFRAELEGWWFERLSSVLSSGKGPLVPLIELDARIGYLREKYKISSLQVDVDDPAEHPEHLEHYLFMKQVRVLKVSDQRVSNVQRDFLKAGAQRSKWLRQSRIDPAELNKYDVTLQASWFGLHPIWMTRS
jgi:hypothetical protein